MESLAQLPPMPPGWKPGDPLPELPPMPPGQCPPCIPSPEVHSWPSAVSGHPACKVMSLVAGCEAILNAPHGLSHAGWQPGDPIPDLDAAGAGAGSGLAHGQQPAGQVTQEQPLGKQAEKQEKRGAGDNPAFDFILNPNWESVEEDFSDDSE